MPAIVTAKTPSDVCLTRRLVLAGMCSTQIFRVDSTDSCDNPFDLTPTQPNYKFANLTQLRLNSFESELSQI